MPRTVRSHLPSLYAGCYGRATGRQRALKQALQGRWHSARETLNGAPLRGLHIASHKHKLAPPSASVVGPRDACFGALLEIQHQLISILPLW